MLRGHLSAFAGEFQEAVVVDGLFQFVRNQQFAKYLHPLQMGQNMLGLGGTGRLAQPCQNAVLGTIAICQYAVERMAMMIGQPSSQRFVRLARAARQRFAAHAFDNIERWQDDVLLPQHLNQCFSKYDAPISLLGQIG